MTQWQRPEWRNVSIPLRKVDEVYGRDNHDNAGDDLVYFLRTVFEYPDQYRYRFAFDTAHPNPWYHTIDFEIEGISDTAYDLLVEKIVAAGILDPAKP